VGEKQIQPKDAPPQAPLTLLVPFFYSPPRIGCCIGESREEQPWEEEEEEEEEEKKKKENEKGKKEVLCLGRRSLGEEERSGLDGP